MLSKMKEFRRSLAVLSLLFALGVAGPAQAAKTVVTDVRVGVQGSATRIVFEVTRQVAFSVFTLDNPYRLVIDLPEVGWRLPPRPLPGATGVFQKLRYGLFKPGNSRVVLDIRTPAAISKAFILGAEGDHAYRLVIDLTPTTHQAFMLGVGKTPLRVASVQPPAQQTAQPASRTEPAPSPALAALAPPKMVLVKGREPAGTGSEKPSPGQEQATPFRLAPRKPEPKHRHWRKCPEWLTLERHNVNITVGFSFDNHLVCAALPGGE